MKELYGRMMQGLIAGDKKTVNKLVQEALENDATSKEILDKGLIPSMDIVGQRMKSGQMFIPEVMLSAKVMQGVMNQLAPLMAEEECIGLGTVVLGTVEGDLHDVGKNLVAIMLQGAGFNVVDLGVNIAPVRFVEAIKEKKAVILGMSALLTTTMLKMEETVKALEEVGIRHQVKIMAGGAPVTQEFVERIGADAYGANAATATEKAKALVNRKFGARNEES